MNIKNVEANGSTYSLEDSKSRKMLANEYNPETSYQVGDYCIYNDVLKKATEAAGGGEYDPSQWTTVNMTDEIQELKEADQELQESNSELDNKTSYKVMRNEETGSEVAVSGYVTTLASSNGVSGYWEYTVPESGLYFLKGTFTGQTSGSATSTSYISFYLRRNGAACAIQRLNGSSEAWNSKSNSPCTEICTIRTLEKGDIITPDVSTPTAGLYIQANLYLVKLHDLI
jgi:hypothetical protein